ncbi:hypothetical protein V5O48_001024 [Marasmius crinis-equi]|uniref:Major facilitator superfamily (MFS) profile domain-containing protein n=1 Tax=Marasmius crinis-equi TaxID=585013 RepID=A0ABR3FZN7_9AGAR
MASIERQDGVQSENGDIEKSSNASANKPHTTEGSAHQDSLGPKAKRRHFFSPLDRAYADAVHEDAKTVEFTPEEDYKVKRKIDNTVLPLVILSFLFNQFDRTNIGNAHVIDEFNENFGITDNNKWTVALSIFYVGYCLLEMPANVLQRHIGANRL